ncbi:Hypothetical protein AKI40_1931 [Enterobacter sp. FY-07]|nr:Hypothetical protein AKI40_1931 [Enterobacter sp. FY-07]
MMAHGITALINSASGTRITLFSSDPLATLHTTGNSRFARTPATCCALSDRSSPSTPAVFFAASFPITEMSSSNVAMSSSKVNKLLPAKISFLIDYVAQKRAGTVAFPQYAVKNDTRKRPAGVNKNLTLSSQLTTRQHDSFDVNYKPLIFSWVGYAFQACFTADWRAFCALHYLGFHILCYPRWR